MNLDGREIEVAQIRARAFAAPTLVFLHEGLGSVALWRDFPAQLVERSGFGALIYSRVGNGFSAVLQAPRTPSYMHDEALVMLPKILDAFAIERALFVGHSDGASIALIFAARYPERVAGVAALAPHVFVEELSLRSIAAIRTQYVGGELRKRMAPHHTDVDATFYGWNDIWLNPEFRAWNIKSEIERITAPILCIQGCDDEYGTLAQIDAIAARAQAPVDRVILARCGHAPQRDRTDMTLATIAGWLSKIPTNQ